MDDIFDLVKVPHTHTSGTFLLVYGSCKTLHPKAYMCRDPKWEIGIVNRSS
jgi:hypothetical protein